MEGPSVLDKALKVKLDLLEVENLGAQVSSVSVMEPGLETQVQ